MDDQALSDMWNKCIILISLCPIISKVMIKMLVFSTKINSDSVYQVYDCFPILQEHVEFCWMIMNQLCKKTGENYI